MSAFRKKLLKPISVVEYSYNSLVVRVMTQFEIEETIMNENSCRFKLATILLLL